MALRRAAATRLEVEADFDHHPDNDAPGIIWNDLGRECAGVWGSLSTNLFGHGSEKVSLDLRAGSTAYLSAEPQMGILTVGLDYAHPGDGKPGPHRRRQSASDQQRLRQSMIRTGSPKWRATADDDGHCCFAVAM
jgi:hypothetical protein